MPRPIHDNLVARLRRPDPTARQIIEAHVVEYNTDGTPRAHIRQTKAGPTGTRWSEADSLTGLLALDNGDLTLSQDSVTTLISHAAGTDELTDLSRTTPIITALIEWDDSIPNDRELSRITARLNPRRSGSQRREVTRWRLQLYRLVDGRDMQLSQVDGNPATGVWFSTAPIADPIDVAVTGDGEGDVAFDFTTLAARPRPKAWPALTNRGRVGLPFAASPTNGIIHPGRHYMVVAIYALASDGSAAGNVAWDYASATASVSSGGTTVRSREWHETGAHEGRWQDGGSAGGTPRIVVESGAYVAATITFSSNPFDLGATPAGDMELVGRTQTPPGTSITLEVRNDADSAWVPFTDGQLHSDVGIGKTQPRKMRATLTPNGAGSLRPTLKQLGIRAVTRIDLSRICEVREYEEAFEPETMKVEANRFGSLVALKNGPQDFRSAIEDLLAGRYPRHVLLRAFIGDSALPRHQWLHKTDFLLGEWTGHGSHVVLEGLSPLVKLRDLVPPYSPGTSYAPDGDHSVGIWTTDTGSGSNLYQRIDEPVADETDYVQSGLHPSNQQVVFTLPTPSDVAGRRFFVDCDYAKDAAGGEVIDLTIQVYQSTTLIAQIVKSDIGADRVQSTMELSEDQIALLTDLPNLRLAFAANTPSGAGNRRALVFWARFRTGGRREVVTYTNQTLKAAYDDLVDNRLALEARYRGPGIESTAYTVSKQLTGLRGRNPNGKDIVGKDELQYLAYLAGGVIHEVQGRIQFTSVLEGKAIAAVFPSSRIRVGGAGPGLQRRVPEFFVGYRWDEATGEFRDEAHAFHAPSIEAFGTDTLGPPKWLDEEIGRWIDTDALAQDVAVRHVNALGCGLMLWPFWSQDAYPELHIGDLVAVEVDKFVARDPSIAREIRGRNWVVGVIQRADFWGRNFTVWVRSYADILASSEGATRVLQLGLQEVQPIWRGLELIVPWVGDPLVRSVKIATSTSAFPATGTGTTANGRSGEYNAGAFALADSVYVTITPYSGIGATGFVGTPLLFLIKAPQQDQAVPFTGGEFYATSGSDVARGVPKSPVLNGDFEDGFAYWATTQGSGVSIETGSPLVGAKSLRIAVVTGGTLPRAAQVVDPGATDNGGSLLLYRVLPRDVLMVSAIGKLSGAGLGVTMQVVITEYDEDKVVITDQSFLAWTVETSATQKRSGGRLGDNTRYISVRVQQQAAAGSSGTFDLDELHIERVGSNTTQGEVRSLGAKSADFDVDWNEGNYLVVNPLQASVTITGFLNPISGGRYLLFVVQDGTGSRAITWPASVHWPSGTAPTASGANKIDVYEFEYRAADGVFYARVYGQNYA